MTRQTDPSWIGYDAQTGQVWAFDQGGQAQEQAEAAAGPPDAWGTLPMIACGLGGAPRALPCPPLPAQLSVQTTDTGRQLVAIPPLSQDNPPELTAGEEARIAGVLASHPGFDGVLCLTGAVTRWALISAEEVVSLMGFATPELASAVAPGDGWDDDAFAEALADAASSPEKLAARLHSMRMGPQGQARARAWGTLIGAELAAARGYWLGQRVMVVGDGEAAEIYNRALSLQGLMPERASGRQMMLAGFKAAQGRLG